jgi:hypothetical protein
MRKFNLDGPITMKPSFLNTPARLSLFDGGGGGGGEPPKPPIDFGSVPQDVRDAISTKAVEAFKATLPKPPEKYNIQLPKDSHLHETSLERTAAIARKLGLPKDELAQELLGLAQTEVAEFVNRTAEQHKQQAQKWYDDALKDAQLGNGKPEQLQAHLARTKMFLEKHFPEGARKLIDEFGLGNHPDFLRGIAKLALAAKEDGWEGGDSSGKDGRSRAERLYPKMRKTT